MRYYRHDGCLYPRQGLEADLKFAFIPMGDYKIGQIIQVHGEPMRVESYSHTGQNVVAHTLENAKKFRRVVCIKSEDVKE